MKKTKHLLYIGDLTPGPGQGGQIILDRHLRRIAAEGWVITVISSALPHVTGPWIHHTLPARRWWWPPFRPRRRLLAWLRTRAWLRELRAIPHANAIITVAGGRLGWLAAEFSKSKRCPLVTIVHDHWREHGQADDVFVATYVCRSSKHLLAVSEEMRASLAAEFPSSDCTVLPPVPATRSLPFAEWRDTHATAPVFAHVGALHAYHAEFLERLAGMLAPLGGTLLLLSPEKNPVATALRDRLPNLRHQPFFPQNNEAVSFIAQNATAIVVMYPFGTDGNTSPPTGFPSRFVEFAQLGLPILIAAPRRNPIRAWAIRHEWPAQIDPSDQSALAETCSRLSTPSGWAESAHATREVAQNEFDAERIHDQFIEQLENA